jgi:predicted AAA+ superfamily ATPase
MEIRVERRLTGREYREEILSRHGSRSELEARAEEGDARAQDDLLDLELLEEDPNRLEVEYEVETVAELDAGELARLTPERLRLLAALPSRSDDETTNVTGLARELGRDKKNVSEDLQLLEDLGLLDLVPRGREKIVRPPADEVHIVLETRDPDRGEARGGEASA